MPPGARTDSKSLMNLTQTGSPTWVSNDPHQIRSNGPASSVSAGSSLPSTECAKRLGTERDATLVDVAGREALRRERRLEDPQARDRSPREIEDGGRRFPSSRQASPGGSNAAPRTRPGSTSPWLYSYIVSPGWISWTTRVHRVLVEKRTQATLRLFVDFLTRLWSGHVRSPSSESEGQDSSRGRKRAKPRHRRCCEHGSPRTASVRAISERDRLGCQRDDGRVPEQGLSSVRRNVNASGATASFVLDDSCPDALVDAGVGPTRSRSIEMPSNDAPNASPRRALCISRHSGGTVDTTGIVFVKRGRSTSSIQGAGAGASRCIAITEELFGRRALPFQTLNFPVGTEQHPHIDAFYFNSDPDGLHVRRMDRARGHGHGQRAALLLPGSHKLPLPRLDRDRASHGNRRGQRLGRPKSENNEGHGCKHSPLLPGPDRSIMASSRVRHDHKGQALIWAANLSRRRPAAKTRRRTRHSQVTHYYFEGCRHYRPYHDARATPSTAPIPSGFASRRRRQRSRRSGRSSRTRFPPDSKCARGRLAATTACSSSTGGRPAVSAG